MEGLVALYGAAIAVGVVHGAEPGHGWPIAATYALDRDHTRARAVLASSLLGVGHLVSSVAVVVAYFFALSYFDVTRLPYLNVVAGVLLILLGIREFTHGHAHTSGEDGGDADTDGEGRDIPLTAGYDHEHPHPDGAGHAHDHEGAHSHSHAHGHAHDHGWVARVRNALPFVGGHTHGHDWGDTDTTGLWGLVTTAFVLGFAHEEEFEIIALCTGATGHCLPLMLVYAVAVIVALVGLTLLLVAGYQRYEERVEGYAVHLPTFSGTVLVLMGVGFLLGLL
jgi:cytochrome c biogenesis protein CcdA